MNNELIYLASPYKHANPMIRHDRFQRVCEMAAALFEAGFQVMSPIAHSVPIAAYLPEKAQHYEYWRDCDHEIIRRCDRVFIFKLAGWDESVSVTDEIEFAHSLGKPVHYLTDTQLISEETDGILDA